MYINEEKRSDYLRNLKVFAGLREAMALSDKVVFAASARLLDPYESTTPESRARLLNQYPIHQHGHLKRAVVFGLTNVGFSEQQDRTHLGDLLFAKLKPLEAHLDSNNQAFCIDLDSKLVDGMISATPMDGYSPFYVDGEIIGGNAELFDQKRADIDWEAPAYHEAYAGLVKNKFINHLVQIGLIVFNPSLYLTAAIQAKVMTFDEAALFATNQCALIKAEIEKAMIRKNKAERENTAIFKEYLNQYVIFANDMLMKQNAAGLAS